MKAVLLNDFKLVKKMALPFAIFIGVILALSVVITREISNKFFVQWAFTLVFTIRAQVAFGDNFKDFEKFMTMPVSIEDYSLAKIIKNLITFLITSIIFLIGLIFSNGEDKELFINMYVNVFIAIDFLSLSFSHILKTKYARGIVVFIYALLFIGLGIFFAMTYAAYYESLVNYKLFLIIGSIIIICGSFYLDYKYSTKYLREGHIIWKYFY